jgi:tRNA U34 2-thiouridine synthase MnmA/TrmU
MPRKIKALGLLSGGLDSMLAGAVLRAQGIEVTFICFVTPFYGPAKAREAAAQLGLPLKEVDLTEKFEPLLYEPPHGFGKGHNPCIDCHALMIREAGAMMTAEGFDFVFTGEVLGQRPMSQNRGSLNVVARESGLEELLLRPLSAKLLKTTRPELEGWVDRERLLNLSGRGRTRQIALAAEYGITRYPAPAGGCLLTDPHYAQRIKELLRHQERPSRRDLEILKWGRHLRLPGGAKAVVGRTQRDNEAILGLKLPEDHCLRVEDYPGPIVLVIGGMADADRQEASGLAAAYSDAATGVQVQVRVEGGDDDQVLNFETPSKERFKSLLI